METVKWFSPDSADGERSLKQHAFIAYTRKRAWTHEEYEGNRAVCNRKAGIMNENEEFDPIDKIEGEELKEDRCAVCKEILSKKAQ
jgi:hypothetical protein